MTEHRLEYSFGKTDDEYENSVIRVDNGPFAGTVFAFKDPKIAEEQNSDGSYFMHYGTDIALMRYNGESVLQDDDNAEAVVAQFHENVTNIILHELIQAAIAQGEKDE